MGAAPVARTACQLAPAYALLAGTTGVVVGAGGAMAIRYFHNEAIKSEIREVVAASEKGLSGKFDQAFQAFQGQSQHIKEGINEAMLSKQELGNMEIQKQMYDRYTAGVEQADKTGEQLALLGQELSKQRAEAVGSQQREAQLRARLQLQDQQLQQQQAALRQAALQAELNAGDQQQQQAAAAAARGGPTGPVQAR
jgi:hypothetical protein